MIFAFALYKYFPYGGLQRDFLRIAETVQARGHQVRVYCYSWQGGSSEQFEVVSVPVKGQTNQAKNCFFSSFMQQDLAQRPVDCVVGFNKMPGLDVYYAADGCYAAKSLQKHGKLYALTPRFRHFKSYEEAVFGKGEQVEILMISSLQLAVYQKLYDTEDRRFHMLSPGICKDRIAPDNAAEIRASFRQEFGLGEQNLLVLMVGSGFKTKGVDRALLALSALPEALKKRTRMFVIGQDNASKFKSQANKLALSKQVTFFAGRDDIPRFLLAADLLLHPAYHENTGTVLLEAVVAGLPVLTTANCGYAEHISKAQAGRVLPLPFEQLALNHELQDMLTSDQQLVWRENGVAYAAQADIYDLVERAAKLIEQLLYAKLRKGIIGNISTKEYVEHGA